MAAFADTFKAEVARIARKEGKDDLTHLRKAVAAQRSEIAGLKKELKALSSQVKGLAKSMSKLPGASAPAAGATGVEFTRRGGRKFVFRPEALAAKRAKIGVTQREMGVLLGAAHMTVNKWETGKATPRAAQLERIRAVLAMGLREARVALASSEDAGAAE
ncbi:helix-turn-helix domain-containing protein [Acidovorax sp.]|uniref:helix-turn-helix domain-containing protein n=1 Tax=Acidovorax sp. TaxID=1872122 RepID=UPI00391F4995